MAAAPRVTIVMPVYDAEAYLKQALESILEQAFGDWELIAIDDGSRDGSRSILDHFAATDPRIKLLSNTTNLGIVETLNRGWREARGQYIARLDADDVALPNRLSRQVEFLDEHPAVALVGSAAIRIDSDGRHLSIAQVPTSNRGIKATLPRHNCFNHPSVMLKRAALEAVGGYRFDHVEDYDLWLRLSERFDLANLTEPLILYRIHAGQVSLRALEEQVCRALAVRVAARRRRAGRPDPLSGTAELTPDLLSRLGLSEPEISGALRTEVLFMASFLADVGRESEARELVRDASEILGARGRRAFAAATALRLAERFWTSGRRFASFRHLFTAIWLEPVYSSRSLCSRVGVLIRGRLP